MLVLVAVPPGVVTLIVPVAPLPTVALIVVALTTVKDAAATPPMVDCGRPGEVRPGDCHHACPPPLVGVNEVMVGAGMKVKLLLLVAVPPGVVTMIVPVAPLPTVAVMMLR